MHSQGFGSAGSSGLREEDWVAGELEGVLYIQSLILFAPQAVPASAHLPVLLPPLASRHPALRRAAAATLRHLAEKSPSVMLPARLEKLLFNALDAEVDSDIAAHIQVWLLIACSHRVILTCSSCVVPMTSEAQACFYSHAQTWSALIMCTHAGHPQSSA